MIALFLDTCTKDLNIGITKDNTLLYKYQKESKNKHSEITLTEIKKALKDISIKPENIDKIIVTIGPGSYTGIRIGVTIAKTFGWSLEKQVIPASSLKVKALSEEGCDYYVTKIDARRDHFYAAIYDKYYNEVLKEQYISELNLEEEINKLEGKIKQIEEISLNIISIVNYYKDKGGVNPHSLNPIYLKKTEAEENL